MPQFSGETDSVHRVTLPSAIDSVRWSRQEAAPGGTVGLTVNTLFCGDGSAIRIDLQDAHGTVHSTLSGQLRGHTVTVDLSVPREAEDALIAIVQMPNHGLSAQSPVLYITDPVRVRRPVWSQSKVRRGEVVTLTAEARGAPDGRSARVRIYERDPLHGVHDPVTHLRPTVQDGAIEVKWQFEYPGDTDAIVPDWKAGEGYRQPTFFYRVTVDGVEADSTDERRNGILTFVDTLTLQVVDAGLGGPYADQDVEITRADGSTSTHTLDAHGLLTMKDVAPGPARVTLPNAVGARTEIVDAPDGSREIRARQASDGSFETTITTGAPWRIWIVKDPVPLSA